MFYRTSLLALSALTATVLSAAVLAAPRAAQAGTIALTPMLTESSLAPEDRAGVYQVLSSELDFSPEVDKVVELTEVPRGLDDWCLTNARCLEAIAIEHDAHGLVTGRLTARGSTYVLDVVYFQGGRIVRRKAFTVPRDPTALANSMNPVVRELLTGVDPRAEARQEATVDDFELDHDELEVAQGTPTESLVDEDVFAFDFGAANRGDISVAEMSEERAEPHDHSASGVVPGVVGGASEQAAERDPDRLARTRGPRQPPARTSGRTENRSATRAATRSPGPARSAARLPRRQEEVARNVRLAVRGGYSNYYAFDFVTGGIEGAVRLGQGGVQLVAGVEMYAVNRVLPPHIQIEEGVYSEWDLIYPLNAGLVYQFGEGALRPYLGADGILVQYFRDEVGGDWAGGARFRLGMDYMVVDSFGLNVNVAAGAWTGQNWGLIEQGVRETGFLPQVSAGAVFAF